MAVRYFVAQYVPDLFRKEPRNVGVVVSSGASLAARFVGESAPGSFDGRKLRGFSYPEIYKEWVLYWRKMVASNDVEAIVRSSREHYIVGPGGEVTDTGDDPLDSVVNYLYSTLVSDGGFQEALSPLEPAAADEVSSLRDDVKRSFQSLALLEQSAGEPVAHPVRINVAVRGKSLEHRPAFSQANGSLYAMEPVDLTVLRRRTAVDHAGLAAYMFKDLREAGASCFSLVRFREEDLEAELVDYALKMLRNESDVINWLDDEQRQQFVSGRQMVAMSA
jgi:hypothetical protein